MITQTLTTRLESDSLGEVTLASGCLHGINTARGRENFAISHRLLRDEPAFVRALSYVKKAAALANFDLGVLPSEIANAIVAACEEIAEGRHHEHFVIDMLEGSGGTSINMNANEVIANRALQIRGCSPGDYRRIHPNDHVNLGQSTNDVVPTALKLAVYEKAGPFLRVLDNLAAVLTVKADEFSDVLRLGRTCLQSAQPMTLGQAFGGYAAAVRRARETAAAVADGLLIVPLGGTAIGTGLGAAAGYREAALRRLAEVTGWPISGSDNLFDGMQNADQFARFSNELRTAANIIGKIASDLVILAREEQLSMLKRRQTKPLSEGGSGLPWARLLCLWGAPAGRIDPWIRASAVLTARSGEVTLAIHASIASPVKKEIAQSAFYSIIAAPDQEPARAEKLHAFAIKTRGDL